MEEIDYENYENEVFDFGNASYSIIFDDGYDPNEDPDFENMDVDTDESVTMILMTILSLMTAPIKRQLSVVEETNYRLGHAITIVAEFETDLSIWTRNGLFRIE